MIDVRRCRHDEVPLVMAFIDKHWQPGHALAVSRPLMDWQHGAADGHCDYLIAIRGEDEVLGVLGYIASRRFDPALAERNVMWLALWKVLDDIGVTGLGLRMLNTLSRLEPHVAIAVNGINAAHPPMYRALRYQTGELKRFYVLNPATPPQMLQAPVGFALPMPSKGASQFVEMTARDLTAIGPASISSNAANPKSPKYFVSRFLEHPFYRYRVFFVEGPSHGPALLAIRIAQHEQARALRIVDFMGDPAAIGAMGSAVAGLMEEERAEFADFWQLGLPDEQFEKAGFALLDADGPAVLPNYFEPFVARNGRMLYALRTTTGAAPVICRADGDQDRPNRLPRDERTAP